ncbi:MAG: YraN family protein [Planctomycetes bacterium]|nr:YraN family protein [Planctomycetota bacterium]
MLRDKSQYVTNVSIGSKGELLAEAFLKKQGYRIVERNFRCKFGEIDIIGFKKGVLSFIEVKTRSSDQFGLPIDSVDKAKQKRLIRLANYYLYKKKAQPDLPCRFDVVSILMKKDKPEIEFIPNAFAQP